ncbi:hypothetical protein EDB86DRAFT_2826694 [Lactarius hatsudake]|nr:hypothetical protein EDB86DRAFT_2826694 [Lactarius hatsudake]
MIRLLFAYTDAQPVVLGSLSPKLRTATWPPVLLGHGGSHSSIYLYWLTSPKIFATGGTAKLATTKGKSVLPGSETVSSAGKDVRAEFPNNKERQPEWRYVKSPEYLVLEYLLTHQTGVIEGGLGQRQDGVANVCSNYSALNAKRTPCDRKGPPATAILIFAENAPVGPTNSHSRGREIEPAEEGASDEGRKQQKPLGRHMGIHPQVSDPLNVPDGATVQSRSHSNAMAFQIGGEKTRHHLVTKIGWHVIKVAIRVGVLAWESPNRRAGAWCPEFPIRSVTVDCFAVVAWVVARTAVGVLHIGIIADEKYQGLLCCALSKLDINPWNPGTPGRRILGQSATIPGLLGSVTLGKLLRETLTHGTQEGKGGAGKGKSGFAGLCYIAD